MAGVSDNRELAKVTEDSTQVASTSKESGSQTAKEVIIRVETGGKEEDPKDVDEKQDVEKPLMEEGNAESETVNIETPKDKDTPTLPLPPFKSRTTPETEKAAPSMYRAPVARVRYEWNASSSLVEFFTKSICIFFSSVGWLVVVGGIPLMPVVELIIGSIYLGECPAEPRIPEYLIVAGFFGIVLHILATCTKYTPPKHLSVLNDHRKKCLCLETVLQIFLLIWFFAGCSWVYGIFEPEYELEYHEDYCHKTLYLFTFWVFNITFLIFLIFVAIFISCIACISINSGNKEENEQKRTRSSSI